MNLSIQNLHIPQILPDELGLGYFACTSTANELTEDELFDRLKRSKPRILRPSKYELLAELAGLSNEDFVCGHTCKPFHKAFETRICWCHPHGTNERKSPNNRMLLHRREKHYFCDQCANDDFNYWGRSSWRCSHQISGICWCSKHHTPLRAVLVDSLSRQPHELRHDADLCISLPFPKEDSVAGRYQKLVGFLLDFRRPVFLPLLTAVLKESLRIRNYSCSTTAHGEYLVSDTILECCPTEWCRELFDDFSKKVRGKYFRNIDAIAFSYDDATATYVLALSVLFYDSDRVANFIAELSILTTDIELVSTSTMSRLYEELECLN